MKRRVMKAKRTRAPKYVYVLRNGQFIKMRVTKIAAFVLEEVKA